MVAATSSMRELSALAREAGQLAQTLRPAVTKHIKADGSIVTEADRAVESFLRDRLAAIEPSAGFWGEESERCDSPSGLLWIVDPIDGTTNYAYGSPLWGVSIALAHQGTLEIGAVALPDLREEYSAARGLGTYRNHSKLDRIESGPIKAIEPVGITDTVLLEYSWARQLGKQRHVGSFVIDGTFFCQGRLRAVVGLKERLYDIAACMLMANEVGAEIRYCDGSEMSPKLLLDGKSIDRPFLFLPKDCLTFPL